MEPTDVCDGSGSQVEAWELLRPASWHRSVVALCPHCGRTIRVRVGTLTLRQHSHSTGKAEL